MGALIGASAGWLLCALGRSPARLWVWPVSRGQTYLACGRLSDGGGWWRCGRWTAC